MRTLLALLCAAPLAACGDDPATTQTSTTATIGSGDGTTSTGGETSTAGDTTIDLTTVAPTGTSEAVGECEREVQTLVLARPNAMLVLEKSGAMVSQTWDHDGLPDTPAVTRWSSVHAAVDAVVGEYEAFVDIGVNLSPAMNATNEYGLPACRVSPEVEVSIAPVNRAQILSIIPPKAAEAIQGGWPVAASLTVALEHLKSQPPGERRTLVLLAHGLPACNAEAVNNAALFEVYDGDAPIVVETAFAVDGIPIHVVTLAVNDTPYPVAKDGRPDNEIPLARWTELAAKGGAGPLVNATSEAQVADALRSALDTVLVDDPGCVLPLTTPLEQPDKALVEVDGEEVPRVSDCAGEDGWRFVEPAAPYKAIELCGAACEQLRQAGEAEVADCRDPIGAPPRPDAAPELR